jgi:hypothetical protein
MGPGDRMSASITPSAATADANLRVLFMFHAPS